ncbi:hypothetical protein IOD13_07175 [Brevibacterium casei]|nr:hypothetical protein [Brevibacterium casei]
MVLVDTPALYYRAFYSVPDSIVNDEGRPVNAVRGVVDAVAQMIRRFSSARVVAAMDADWRPAFRTAIMPEYKAARIKDEVAGTEIPPELDAQLPIMRRVLAAAGIPIAEVDGTEADDVIATIAAQSATPVVIVSPDRDLLALLDTDRDVSVLRPRKGNGRRSPPPTCPASTVSTRAFATGSSPPCAGIPPTAFPAPPASGRRPPRPCSRASGRSRASSPPRRRG